VKNAAGSFVKASLQSTSAAAASVKNMPDDFRISITNAAGKNSYPISSFTYLLIPTQWQDQTKKNAVIAFLNWMLDQGQSMVEQLNYAPLPQQVVQREKAKIKELQ
jgi:phosphate transport system substrate-binding protein